MRMTQILFLLFPHSLRILPAQDALDTTSGLRQNTNVMKAKTTTGDKLRFRRSPNSTREATNITLDPAIREQAKELFYAQGKSPSEAVNDWLTEQVKLAARARR